MVIIMKRIVMKFGTKVLTKDNGKGQRFYSKRIDDIAARAYALRLNGFKAVIVTSGSFQLGIEKIGAQRPERRDFSSDIEYADELAVLAGMGTDALAREYQQAFRRYEMDIAYTLFTSNNFDSNEKEGICRRLNKTMDKGHVIIANTNDFVTLEELLPIYNGDGFSDNDPFTYQLSSAINAAEVYFVTTSAVYDKDPNRYDDAKKLDVLTENMLKEIDCFGTSGIGRGGMEQKIKYGFKCAKEGMLTYIIGIDELDKIGKNDYIGTRIIA